MIFFRQFVAPLLIFLTFMFTLVLVSSRAFLPSDMVEPAPVSALPLGEIAPIVHFR